MSTPPPELQNVPIGLIYISFGLTLILTILKIIEGIVKTFHKPNLEVAVTEVFFRILESGESLYVNSVVVAHDVGALLKNVKVTLRKETGAKKEFNLRVGQIGEKYRAADGNYQFGFHSNSPVAFILESNPLRQVYICEHESYAAAVKQEFQKFKQSILVMQERYEKMRNEKIESNPDQVTSEVENLLNNAFNNIIDNIQIEAGDYTLVLTVIYRQKSKYMPIPMIKTTESKIQFTVDDYAREFIKVSLKSYLRKTFQEAIFGKTETILAPEYIPSNVKELC